MSTPTDFNKGHTLVDLDGTLAQYEHWQGIEHIGEPVPAMLAKVKKWLEEGRDVRIFTARIWPETVFEQIGFLPNTVAEYDAIGANAGEFHRENIRAGLYIREWCVKHLGRVLPITCRKDFGTVTIWDDRAVGVVPNMGIPHETIPALALHRVCEAIGCKVEDGQAYMRAADMVTAHIRKVAGNAFRAQTKCDNVKALLDGAHDALRYGGEADILRAKQLIGRALDLYKED